MKTTSAVIKLKLYTSKTLGNGENPIMISVAWGGQQKYKSTGFSCTPKYWDTKNEMVKRGYPNFTAINEAIIDKKNKIIAKKIGFEKTNTPYTSSMLLEEDADLRGSKLLYKDIQDEYIKKNNLKHNTVRGYKNVFSLLKEYFGKEDFSITEITNDMLKNLFIVQNKDMTGNTVSTDLSKIITIINYANIKGLTNHQPTEAYKTIRKFFKKNEKHQCFLECDIEKIYECYRNQKDNLSKAELLALECWLTSFTLFGLAPVDILLLNTRRMKDIDGVISFETARRKTHVPVNIQMVKTSHPEATEILEKYISTSNLRNGFIFPCLDGTEKSETELIKKTSNFINLLNRGFKTLLEKCEIKSQYTMYSSRHSFATMMLRGGLPIDTIASALGRSVSNIGCYLANLTKSQDLQEVSSAVSLTSITSRIKKVEESA